MKKEFGLIIKMPTEMVSQEEIEERKSKFYNLLAKWAFEAYLKDKGIEDMYKGLELPDGSIYNGFDEQQI